MTEMANGIGQSSDVNSVPVAPSSEPMSITQPAKTEERTFKQADVDNIVKRAKHDAVESFKRIQSEQPEYHSKKFGDVSHQPQPNVSEQEIRRLAGEEAKNLRDQWVKETQDKADLERGHQIVQTFWNKVAPGREKYSDFDKVTGNIDYQKFPSVVQLLADYVDNAPDVLYALGEDRIKLANLEQLARMSANDAVLAAQRLSQSIKDNEAGQKMRVPNEPLSQMRPTNSGTDNGAMSVSDLRRKYRG